ncbi:MAG TPA: thermonuclease family protein [Actinomycetota bacterium]|nr:thermonuclease family protein [Actinomycetota bacterium]
MARTARPSPARTAGVFLTGLALLMTGCQAGATDTGSTTSPSPAPRITSIPEPTPRPTPSPEFETEQVTVRRVVDGDTVEVEMADGRTEKVRLIGVDTPESTTRHERYGSEASAYTSKELSDRDVWLETDAGERDRYSRLLAYVWLVRPLTGSDGEVRENMFNARLLLDGFAQVMTVPPNVKYAELFVLLQSEAREARTGLWGLDPEEAPAPARRTVGAATTPRLRAATTPRLTIAPRRTTAPPRQQGSGCHPSYPDFCIPPPPPDLDCKHVSGSNFTVQGEDPHGFDGDDDGVGCEG